MTYKTAKTLDLVSIEKEILTFWEKEKVFKASMENRKEGSPFTFYEGPPSANGTPGIHHVMARTVKDIFCRYKTLQGFWVDRKGGWDTHGLPVELQVEKELNITKEDIGKTISVEAYNQKCKETVMKYKNEWDDLTKRIGYWVDLEKPYITFETNYIESVWAILKELYNKDLMYKGYTVQPYSPAAGTGLSSHELNIPGCYKMVKDTAVTAQFKVVKNLDSEFLFSSPKKDSESVYILAWTTTPWTLPSNCALAVGKHIDYVPVKTYNPYTYKPITVVLAKDLVPKHFSSDSEKLNLNGYQPGDKHIPYCLGEPFKGQQLIDVAYEQLMPYVQPKGRAFVVIPADFVTTEDGTGIVHTASVFGVDDFRACQANGISSILGQDKEGNTYPLVDKKGRFVKEVSDFAGYYLKPDYESEEKRNQKDYLPTDVLIAIKLKKENKAFKVEKYEHNYPHCWRTHKPILYYPLDSWFIKTTDLKERMVELNETINWKPESTGTGRFGNWLKNLVDWNLSRSRFWGTPLPVWRTKDGKQEKCIGSLEELKQEVEKAVENGMMPADSKVTTNGKLNDDIDLHRPYIDTCILVSDTGEEMYRETDIVDVWFDSGAMPYAQWHYPFENGDKFEKHFPADYISEGIDQTRGWFFTLHALAVMLKDKIAFKNVISTGLVLDKSGNKMSKSIGNVVRPNEILDNYGADVTRWYMINNAPPWDNLKFDTSGLLEVKRKFFDTLFNVYNFFALYANLDNFSSNLPQVSLEKYQLLDRWIISKLYLLVQKVSKAFDNYEPTTASRAIQHFTVHDFSNWYIRLNRKRFWRKNIDEDKIAAYQILHLCLRYITQLMSPVAPFYADYLFQNLNQNKESVHLSDFPKIEANLIDKDLDKQMLLAQRICSLVHGLRKKYKIKVRQPLQKIIVLTDHEVRKSDVELIKTIICQEINIKTIEYIDSKEDHYFLTKKVKPNYKMIGKKYGKQIKTIAKLLNNFSAKDITHFEQNKFLNLQLNEEKITLTLEEVQIDSVDIEGWLVGQEMGLTVALDVTITEELELEGLARELVNRVQNLRKTIGLKVENQIYLNLYSPSPKLQKVIEYFNTYIAVEIQAHSITIKTGEPRHSLEINNEVLGCDIKVIK